MGIIGCSLLLALSLASLMGITFFKILGLGIALLVIDGNMAVQVIKAMQGLLFKVLLMLSRRNIAKGDENSIAGVIVSLIEGFKLFVG